MRRLVLVAAVLAALIAGGCDQSPCNPGDVKASGSERLKCGQDGAWHR